MGNRTRQSRSDKQRSACIVASFNGNCSLSCSVAVASKKTKHFAGGKQKPRQATVTHVQHTETRVTWLWWISTTDRDAERASCVSEKRAQKHIYADMWLKKVTQTNNNAPRVVLLPLTNLKEFKFVCFLCFFYFILWHPFYLKISWTAKI